MLEMNWIVWLGVISGIASILSLIFTILETKKAKKAASEAIKAKNSICQKQSTIKLNVFLDVAGEIQQHLIGRTGPNRASSQGYNSQKEHQKIENFISKLNEVKTLPDDRQVIDRLEVEYSFFCKANGEDPKPYKDMLYHVREIINIVSKAIRDNVYR